MSAIAVAIGGKADFDVKGIYFGFWTDAVDKVGAEGGMLSTWTGAYYFRSSFHRF